MPDEHDEVLQQLVDISQFYILNMHDIYIYIIYIIYIYIYIYIYIPIFAIYIYIYIYIYILRFLLDHLNNINKINLLIFTSPACGNLSNPRLTHHRRHASREYECDTRRPC